jgi:hypothetical protein
MAVKRAPVFEPAAHQALYWVNGVQLVQVGGFHRSVYPLCATSDRCFTPGPVSSAAWLSRGKPGQEPFPFGLASCLVDR